MEIHTPVLLRESLEFLAVKSGDVVLDATVGTGGHTQGIVGMMNSGAVVALDVDNQSLSEAKRHIGSLPKNLNVYFIESNFRDIEDVSHDLGIRYYDAILVDLGWGSHQLASGRGFSFMHDEVLDMCYSTRKGGCPVTALEVVNMFTERELIDMLREYGEERWASRIAKHIVNFRKKQVITTTKQLADIVSGAIPRKLHPKNIHAATKTFQAIRITVNDELDTLKTFLNSVKKLVQPGSRLAIISFHSLEDRVVKHTFRYWKSEGLGETAKKAVRPSLKERAENPRSRSALLRTFTFTTI